MNDFFSDFRKFAITEGFENCGFAKIKNLDIPFQHYNHWISQKFHADMAWMEEHQEFRLNPKNLFPWAKSYAIVLLNYQNDIWDKKNIYKVSKYAILNDYHFVVKKKLHTIINKLSSLYPSLQYDFFVDSKPLLERALAVETGIGWIGKNNCFIIPKKGSFFFIGGVALNIEYHSENTILKNRCGTCTKCMDACPTKAIIKPNVLDSRKCISYLTIENKGEIAEDLQKLMQGNIIGCDICQNVCPHNHKATNTQDVLLINPELCKLNDSTLEEIKNSDFKKMLKQTPFNRMGYKKLQRNIAIAKQIIPY